MWLIASLVFGALPAQSASTAAAERAVIQTRTQLTYSGLAALGTNQLLCTTLASNLVAIPFTNLHQITFTDRKHISPSEKPGQGLGLLGFYYPQPNFSGSPILRLDPNIQFAWEPSSPPVPGLNPESFSVRWIGQIDPPQSDDYTFHLATDELARLWVDRHGPFSLPTQSQLSETNVTLKLEAGRKYTIRVELVQTTGAIRADLSWSSSKIPKSIVPTDRLYPASTYSDHQVEIAPGPGLLATYFSRPDFSGPTFTRVEEQLQLDWQGSLTLASQAAWQSWIQTQALWQASQTNLDHFRATHELTDKPKDPSQPDAARLRFDQRLRQAEKPLLEVSRELQRATFERGTAEKALAKLPADATPESRAPLELAFQQASLKEKEMQSRRDLALKPVEQWRAILREETNLVQTLQSHFKATQTAAEQLHSASRHVETNIAPGIPINFFSVRWSGTLTPTRDGPCTLHVHTDEGLRFWFNNELVIDQRNLSGPLESKVTRNVHAGLAYPLLMETRNTDTNALARVSWSYPDLPDQPIPASALAAALKPALPVTPIVARFPDFPAGTVLQSGVIISAPIRTANRSTIQFEGPLHPFPMPTLNASRILFRDLHPAQARSLLTSRPGLLLENQDYIEGDLVQIEKGKLTLSSVLFGLRRFDIASQAQALVLKPASPKTNQLAIKLDSKTTLFVNRLESLPGRLFLPDLPLMPLTQSNLWQILRLREP